jgi:hypothetical protein
MTAPPQHAKEKSETRMKKSGLVFLAILLFPLLCLGADKNGNFGSSLPPELKDCDTYIAALDACMNGHCYKENIFNSWLYGYITAYNAYVDDTFNIIGGRDSAALNYWLATYCKKHPHSSFDTAVGHLMAELMPQRIREKPRD